MGTIHKALHHKLSPYAVLLLAVAFLSVLLSMIYPGVFFSGDGGLKYLIVKQLDQWGEFRHIVSTHPSWVEQVWKDGYYPFRPPFVYEIRNEHMITFPLFFDFVSETFYKQFGYYGLYIIPAASVFLTWCSMLAILDILRLSTPTKTMAMIILAFCTPLTFYGAVFWEHSLAIFLFFQGVIYFIRKEVKLLPALLSGMLAGAAILFREETFILLALLAGAIVLNNWKQRRARDFFFIAGMALPVLFYFIFNYIVFGSLFGLHGHQIVAESNVQTQLWKGFRHFAKLNLNQLIHFPFIALFYWMIFLHWRKKEEKTEPLYQLSWVLLLFTLVIPFLLPSAGDKQWGPRFFLSVMPPVIVCISVFADRYDWLRFLQRNFKWRILFDIMIAYSMYMNIFVGGKYLRDDYRDRVFPALSYLKTEPCPNIIVDDQYIAQELTAFFNTRNFFLVKTEAQLPVLLERLKSAGQSECIFISMNTRRTTFSESFRRSSNIQWRKLGSYAVGVYNIR